MRWCCVSSWNEPRFLGVEMIRGMGGDRVKAGLMYEQVQSSGSQVQRVRLM